MQLGIVGLGRMGMNIGARLARRGHEILGYDISADIKPEAESLGIRFSETVPELVGSLRTPRTIWLMIPAGLAVDEAIASAAPHLSPGDIVVDGGNSHFRDSIRRAEGLRQKGVFYLDCGTSGGVWGLENGYCLMVGGDEEAFVRVEPILRDLAPEGGYLRTGPSGAGHFVKMVHNGIEYGMLQAYGEGFELLKASEFDLDLRAISAVWNKGSVVRSWLLELAERAFAESPNLDDIAGYVEDTGEGRWTVMEAIEEGVPTPTLALSLFARFRSRQEESFSAKVVAALRRQFGGHRVIRR